MKLNQTPTFSTNDPNQLLKKQRKLINGRQKINKLDKKNSKSTYQVVGERNEED